MRIKFIVFISLILLIVSCQKQSISPEAQKWKDLSLDLTNIVDSVKYEVNDLHTLSYLYYSKALLFGWNDPEVVQELKFLLSFIESSGFDLNREWDAFGDGTINNDSTIYTITLTDHLGIVLVDAYKSRAINDDILTEISNLLLNISPADSLNDGYCISYSDNINDIVGCVHNVNISYALFLQKMKELDFDIDSIDYFIDEIVKREKSAYLPNQFNFPYWDGNDRLTDQNHLCFQAWCMTQIDDTESQSISFEIINSILSNRDKSISSLIGHLRILPYATSIEDSIYSDLINIKNATDTVYSDNSSYSFDNPRIVSQLAVWSAKYYRHKLVTQ